ncbi:MAG TPA: hypothetical protein DCE56_25020 [Cyanobacteria bacterium UBA8553]|nr:hypothetical protein [Cyanobacteria bacterium UBA8553]
MRVHSCPCCGSPLLRHARSKGVYWFCTSCHQEMMPLSADQLPISVEAKKPRSLNLHSLNT